MTLTTGIFSVSVEVTDLDRAKAFSEDVLGCELVLDTELWPGARLVEVRPPGSPVLVALVTRESGLPIGVRYWTGSADSAHAALTAAGSPPHTEVLHLEGAPPMFTVADPDGNIVTLLEGPPSRPEAAPWSLRRGPTAGGRCRSGTPSPRRAGGRSS